MSQRFFQIALIVAVAGHVPALCARASDVWDGESTTDSNWSTPENWDDDQVPSFPAPLTFNGTTRLNPNNDLTDLTVNGITFGTDAGTTGPFVLGGNGFTLAGNITNLAGQHTFNMPITLAGDTTLSAGNGLTFNSAIGGTGGITMGSNSWVAFNATNTYSGDTTITGGQVDISANQPNMHVLNLGASDGTASRDIDVTLTPLFGTTDPSMTLTGLNVQNITTNTTLNMGIKSNLTINGPVNVGTIDRPTASNGAMMSMGGGSISTININANTGNLTVGGNSTTGHVISATLNVAAALNFTGNEIRIGGGQSNNSGNYSNGTLNLEDGNSSLTASSITVGGGSNLAAGNGKMASGDGALTINADTIYVGTQRSSGTLELANSTTGTVKVRNQAGTGRAAMIVGWQNLNAANFADNMSTQAFAFLGGTGGASDVLLSTLTMGQATNSVAHVGTIDSRVEFGQGIFDITTVQMGSTSVSGVNSGGNLTIDDGATFMVNSANGPGGGTFTLANAGASNTKANGFFAVNGGTSLINCDIVMTGVANSTLSGFVFVQGGTLDMMGHNIGTSSKPIVFAAYSGTLKNLGQLNGGGTLGVGPSNSQVLILDGVNTYTGATNIDSGKMLVNGTHTGGGVYTVASGATLGGTGSTTSTVKVNSGAFLSPGASIESFGVGSTTLNGTLEIDLNDADPNVVDLLNVNGALDVSSATSALDFNVVGTPAAPAYEFASYSSLVGTQFANITDVPSGYTIDYHYNDGASSNNLALVAVPEPSSWVLLSLGFLFFGAMRLRRARISL